jgi:hypothetical protein
MDGDAQVRTAAAYPKSKFGRATMHRRPANALPHLDTDQQ